MHAILEEELSNHAHIQLNLGKTQVWNRGGVVPVGVAELTAAARQVREDAIVWRGDPELRPDQQGVKVLGTPISQSSCKNFWPRNPENTKPCLSASLLWKTFSPVGCCCSCAVPREPTSGCEQFGLIWQNPSQCDTMQECGSVCSIFSASGTLLQRLRPSLSCHSSWGGWAWPVQCGGEPPLIGPVGLTASGW